ncbi:MAG: M3 family metallopeptidase [Thiotrichales bacterium]
MNTTNPLLFDDCLPRFNSIESSHVEPAIDHVLSENRDRVRVLLEQDDYTWSSLIDPIERMEHRLAKVWSTIRHLNAVKNSDAWREAFNRCTPKLSEYATEMAQNRALYNAYCKLADSEEMTTASPPRVKLITNAIRDFHLAGVDLPDHAQHRLKQIAKRLSELSALFADNVLDATQSWTLSVTLDALRGLPDSAIAQIAAAAKLRGLSGYVITLDFPIYIAVLTYAESRSLRESVYQAYTTRASDQYANRSWDNRPLIEEILALRHEQATILEYENFAEYSLVTKMAEKYSHLYDFIDNFISKARPRAILEIADLEHFAHETLEFHFSLEPWDVLFVTERFKQLKLEISQEALRQYFPLERVISGLFTLIQRLFGVTIKERNQIEVWHPDVRFFSMTDSKGTLRGQFYLDMYTRPSKRSGAWMDVCVGRMHIGDETITPVAYLTCNAAPPLAGKPAMLSHEEVITLFHEFGHGLHHLMTRVDYPSIAGINGVEWDAVELPSQWMENWCWHRAGLDLISSHVERGESMPDTLLDRIRSLKRFQTGLQFMRQLEFALFDLRLHAEYDPATGSRLEEILASVRSKTAVIPPPAYNRFANSFTHIFSGGYACAYYSYKWAEVLSADAFSFFATNGYVSSDVGQRFATEILETGASRAAMANFVAFAGRPPSETALLTDTGIQ